MSSARWYALAGLLLGSSTAFGAAAGALTPPVFAIPEKATAALDNYCFSCHDEDTQKGDVRLDNLAALDTTKRLDLLNKMQEQIFFERMPPKKKTQPAEAERNAIMMALAKELGAHHASTLEDKLAKPEYGNAVNHEKLFSGECKALPGFTYDRRWLVSEYIFNAKFQEMLEQKTTGKRAAKNVVILGSNKIQGLSLTNPFLLPNTSGVRYYANEDLTGGHLSSMLTNSQKTSEFITDTLVKRKGTKFLPVINELMALEDRQSATLTERRELLTDHIAKLCEEYYGAKNASLLPVFKPVALKASETPAKDGISKKAPFHVAQGMMKGLGGDTSVYQFLQDPQLAKLPDDAFRDYCERTWFYSGDFERTIQGRMALLRDYLPDFRDQVKTGKQKVKPLVYKPLSPSAMEAVRTAVLKNRKQGDRYSEIINKCVAGWEQDFQRERVAAGMPSDKLLADLVSQLSVQILQRPPTAEETQQYVGLSKAYITKLGKLRAVQKLIQTFILSTEFAYRQEFGSGQPDQYGRRMLAPRDASYAISYALTDQSPDKELASAAANGKLNTREDYKREVLRILKSRESTYLIDTILDDKNYADNTTHLPIRKLRFFREFFGYPAANLIFKDEKRFGAERLSESTCRLINETDRLIEYILEKDQNVFEQLLTTEDFYLFHDGDNQRMQAASDRIKKIYARFKDLDWKNFKNEDLLKHADFLREVKMRSVDPDNLGKGGTRQGTPLQLFKKSMISITARLDKGQKEAAPFDLYRGYGNDFMGGYDVARFFGFALDNWDYQTQQPAKVPNRKGILTHPAWLLAFAKNTETDPVRRGKWVREKLLAGTVADTPINVDAVIPENHDKTLRDRLAGATEVAYCWKCHESMNPLGYAFESYDDFGRFRSEESLEYPDKLVKKTSDKGDFLLDTRDIYKTAQVNPKGYLQGTGDSALDGEVKDAIDLTGRLAKSRRVRQSFIRYAFRYFMGRNESLPDSKTLMDAEQAYAGSGGSFDAVIVSLLTSDSFIYRKPLEN